MAQLLIEIPDAQLTRVRDGYALRHGYTGFRPDGAAETKAQFLKRKLIEHIKESVRIAEEATSVATAAEATRQSVESGVNLT